MIFETLIASFLTGIVGLGVYIYYMRKGQFDDPEDVKYQLFRDENNETK